MTRTLHIARDGTGVDMDAAQQVADCLSARLRAQGVGVVLEAEHSCMTLRGVRAHGAKTVTSALLGTLRTDPRSRAEFFALAGVPH
jgi:GTP cyclohydrolase IA